MTTCVLVPLKTDAFVLNEACCDSDDFRISPISQPNYTFLRLGLKDHLLEADILDSVDLHSTKPAQLNSRLTDLGSGVIRRNRLGVYLHWVLPPFYRTGVGSAPEAATRDASQKEQAGFPARSTDDPSLAGAQPDTTAPEFRPVPNRWLITRRLELESCQPADSGLPRFQSWVVQSDALRRLGDDNDQLVDLDLEVDASPFVDSRLVTKDNAMVDNMITAQSEVFVGKKTEWEKWDRVVADGEPHVDLNVMTSTNPLLVDYQIHNTNIFSILDNFRYNKGGSDMYLESAVADYSVIGWHSEDDDDPMTTSSKLKNDDEIVSHQERLRSCQMTLKDYDPSKPDETKRAKLATQWLQITKGAARSDSRILCHSSMYQVKWDRKQMPKHVGARDAGQVQSRSSVAVGTSDLDALVAYFEALTVDNANLQSAKDDIVRLIHILGEVGEGDLNSLQKFSDEAYKLSFASSDAGPAWCWKAQGDPSNPPDKIQDDDLAKLDQRNLYQAAVDNVKREIVDLRWKIFAIWWTRVSSAEASVNQPIQNSYRDKLKKSLERLYKLQVALGDGDSASSPTTILRSLSDKLNTYADPLKHTQTGSPNFFQRRDPTVLFAGIESGWEPDFSDTVQVRLDNETVRGSVDEPQGWRGYPASFTALCTKVHDEVRSGVKALLFEFFELRPERPLATPPDGDTQVLPLFHEAGRNLWGDTQPWKPLFIEWEALYYHVLYEKWQAHEFASENKFGAKVMQYSVADDVSTMFNATKLQSNDVTRISGRNYLQPQSQSSFKTILQQVFLNTNPDDLKNKFSISVDDQQKLLDVLSAGRFVTAPLTSITNALLTMNEGSHLKPLVRLPHAQPVAMPQAVDTFDGICPDSVTGGPSNAVRVLQQIDDQSSLTPLASSLGVNRGVYPMKPVQHGQLQFVKLNIIDKFGQAIPIIDPSPPIKGQFHTVAPIISRSLFVGTVLDKQGERPNTALLQENRDACPFLSLPPAINQPARINAVFVHKILDPTDRQWKWRRTSDWENPIWGWIVVNYADSGMQIFQADGHFYREIRFGSKNGTSTSFKYLPFAPTAPTNPQNIRNTRQLDYLIDKLRDQDYLRAFWDTITNSFAEESFAHAPTSYSTFSSAVVGKPLALVNGGWSLQLANQPRENWTTTDAANPGLKPARTLLNTDPNVSRWKDRQWNPVNDKSNPSAYTFPVKIGDHSRRYDGLVGYFRPTNQSLQETTSDLDLDHLYTFGSFMKPMQHSDSRIEISDANYPCHSPYWMSPNEVGEVPDRHDDKLQVLGLLVDPFLPVHAFSAILPTSSLALPPWTVEQALKKMTAFWHVGPLVVAHDVDLTSPTTLDDDYTKTLVDRFKGQPLSSGDDANKAGTPSATPTDAATVHLPLSPPTAAGNGGDAKFVYLHPYLAPAGDSGTPKQTRFTPFGIDGQSATGADATEAKLVPGPYTALEGFIQMSKSLSTEIV